MTSTCDAYSDWSASSMNHQTDLTDVIGQIEDVEGSLQTSQSLAVQALSLSSSSAANVFSIIR